VRIGSNEGESEGRNVEHMRVNLPELHRRTGAVVECVARGEVVIVEKERQTRGGNETPKASRSRFSRGSLGSHEAFPSFNDGSGRFISESRDRG
jgi:hypothetical protein